MHGSIIWYQNAKTKECMKIPIRAFSDDSKPVHLKLIYGEDVKPLLIYPAQKAEYIEPLTDLQLMFKQRLLKDTRVLVVVGYSFRDDYIVHMLWDAARANKDLHLILISPNAQEIFDKKLKFTDKDSFSRLDNRVICLPYPFSTVISRLKNDYIHDLSNLCRIEEENIKEEKLGGRPNWQRLLRIAIDCEFLTKAERILEKIKKNWNELDLGGLLPQGLLHYSVKGLLHSIITKDGNESIWLDRVNESLGAFDVENLQVVNPTIEDFGLCFTFDNNILSFGNAINDWIDPIILERKQRFQLLSPKYEAKLDKIREAYNDLEKYRKYLSIFKNRVNWDQYQNLRFYDKSLHELNSLLAVVPQDWNKMEQIVLGIERRELTKIIGGNHFQFRLN